MSYRTTRRKRILSGVLAGAMALTVTPILGFTGTASAADPAPPVADPIGAGNVCENAPASEPFTDVTASDPSYDEIVCLFQSAITQGTTATTYEPNGTLTRRQMAAFLKRLIDRANENEITDLQDLPAYDGDTAPFTDIDDENEEFKIAIGQLEQAGITQGVTATEYRPDETLTRRQMAQFIVRVLEYLTDEEIVANGDYFDDDAGESAAVQEAFNKVAEEGIFIGDGTGNVNPGDDLSRRQMANVLLRTLQSLFADGDISGLFEPTFESLITVDPAGPAVLTVSGTPGTATGDQASRDYTITVDSAACNAIDVALIPFTNLTDNGDGSFTFQDVDGQANRADGLGATQARIEQVNGVNNSTTDGDDYVNNVAVPANRQVTVTVNSQTANQAVAVVAFCDDDNNNQLNLDVDDMATEAVGIGGAQLIVPEEADDLQAGVANVVLDLDILDFFTDGANLFNYDSNDEFDYSSSGIVLGNLSEAEFGEFLSGVVTGQIDDPDLQSGLRGLNVGPGTGPGVVLGDQVQYTYRVDEAGVSSFDIIRDVPAAPTNVVASIGDPDSDGQDEVSVMWDGVSNPDLFGYDVFAQQVINDIPTGDWIGPINTSIVEGESFVGEIDGTPFVPDSTFQIVVLAQSGNGDYGPDSNVETVEIPVDDTPLPLISNEVFVDDTNGNVGEINEDDGFRAEFNQDVALASGATFRLKDLNDGEFATATCGTNATCAVGPDDTIEVTFVGAEPVVNGPVGENDVLDTPVSVEVATGVTSDATGGAWHLPGSAIDGITEGPGQNTAIGIFNLDDDPDVVADGGNGNLPMEIDPSNIDVQDTSPVLSIDPAADLVGGTDLEDDDVIEVYDAAGTLLGSSTYDNTVGAQINVGTLPAMTPLVVQFIDADFATGNDGDDIRSASVLVFVVGDAPVVVGIELIDEANDTLRIVWALPDEPLSQVKPPSAYTVFDEDNTDLVATGDAVTVTGPDTVEVDFDDDIFPGDMYNLRVEAATVQNNNNVPNEAQQVPFTATTPDTVNPEVAAFTANEGDSSFTITFTEAVSGATAGDFFVTGGNTVTGISGGPTTFTLTTGAPLAAGQEVGVNAGSVEDAAGNAGPTNTFTGPVTNASAPFPVSMVVSTDTTSSFPVPSGTVTPPGTGDSRWGVGDVFDITFNEPMDTLSLPAAGDGISTSCAEFIENVNEATMQWISPTVLRITMNNFSTACEDSQYPLDLTAFDAAIRDAAGNAATTSGPGSDNTLEDPSGPYVRADSSAAGDSEFTLTFTERLDVTAAETEANYAVTTNGTNVTTVLDVVCDNAQCTRVRVNTGSNLASGATVTVTMTDDDGNTATHTNYLIVP